jgi:hypothetical protein
MVTYQYSKNILMMDNIWRLAMIFDENIGNVQNICYMMGNSKHKVSFWYALFVGNRWVNGVMIACLSIAVFATMSECAC